VAARTPRTLTTQALNRALLARQLLLDRATLPIADAVEQVGCLQTQYAPSGYVGLWARLAGFRRDASVPGCRVRRRSGDHALPSHVRP